MKKLLSYFVATLLFSFAMLNTAQAEVKVGVQAPRGALKAMKRWGDLGEYLKTSIGSDVKIVPLKPNETVEAVSNGSVDYMLANPVLTVVMVKKLNSVPLATMKKNPVASSLV